MDLNHLHLHVSDLDRSRGFYEKYFGFREHVRHDEILFLRNSLGFDLALVPAETSPFPEWFHFGFRLPSPGDVKGLYSRLSADGVRMRKPLFEADDLVSFRCCDPDDYGIEVYWET